MSGNAAANGAIVIDDIIPGHTGKGADWRLAELGYGLYAHPRWRDVAEGAWRFLRHGDPRASGETARWLDIYFAGGQPDFTPPLHLIGSDFRRRVWKRLLEIPYGQTTTYGALLGDGASARAVGGAVGRNPISIIVPCHRVIGADGSLTGYAGGVDRKIRLLALERQGTKRR